MRLFQPLLAGVFLIALNGCAEEPPIEEILVESGEAAPATGTGPQERIPELEECDAAEYRPLIGTPVSAANLPQSDRLRVYGVSDIVTQEYLPQRTNIVVGEDGLIQRVTCG